MGCGKTITALAIAGRMFLDRRIDRVLIVAPSSVCAVWPMELALYADYPYRCATLLGESDKRKAALAALNRDTPDGVKRLRVAVLNYESTWRLEAEIAAFDPDMIICDESQRIKNPTSRQSKCLHRMGDRARYKLILTGTPLQNSPLDFWSQYRFLDKSVFGVSFVQFRARYAVMGGMRVNGRPVQVVAYRNLDELATKAYDIASRATKAEALDLPAQTFERRPVPLTPAEMRTYRAMQRDSLVCLEAPEANVTATIILTRMMRLQQITGGFLRPDDGGAPVQVASSKLNALDDIIEDVVEGEGRKLVVFARFVPEIEAICGLLSKRKIRHVALWGEVKLQDRGELVAEFQDDPECMVFVAQIDTAGLGITLHAASCAVLYSVNFNYATYQQALSRTHRHGQRHECHYIHLVCPGTIDEHVLDALDSKQDLAVRVVDEGWKKMFKEAPA